MSDNHFLLNEHTLPLVEEIGRHMPGGFFIYQAKQPETILYANQKVFDIFGCDGLEDFKRPMAWTFKGIVHPEDYAAVTDAINSQISHDNLDHMEYRIIRKDGAVRWMDDYGHLRRPILHPRPEPEGRQNHPHHRHDRQRFC